MQKRFARYDKAGEEHFNMLSAYHKSLRGSDPQGALYWMARMLDGGEDPMTLFRRAIAMAAEDIGLADPEALQLAVAARDAFHMLGPPEGYLPLAQMTIYLATAPKSNSAEGGARRGAGGGAEHAGRARAAAHPQRADRAHEGTGVRQGLSVRPRLAGRIHAAGVPPGRAPGTAFYTPGPFGYERRMAERLAWWEKRKQEAEGGEGGGTGGGRGRRRTGFGLSPAIILTQGLVPHEMGEARHLDENTDSGSRPDRASGARRRSAQGIARRAAYQ